MNETIIHKKIAVVGLGYVGLPLACALAKHFSVVGLDVDKKRIEELKNNFDRTNEIEKKVLENSTLKLTYNPTDTKTSNIYIVTVPTPITKDNQPDLTAVKKASAMLGKLLSKGDIVVYESTVYPGVTENICGSILENNSGLICGKDFYLGYSPERINPGDKKHTIDKICKVVSGQTPEISKMLETIYGSINNGNIFCAKSIKAAEAAKVIENAQRDINIAFINEITAIVNKMDISIYDVLDAAKTKWNFLDFKPGLVGGHCIGVDPYYMAYCARKHNYEPNMILSGRKTNENFADVIANSIQNKLRKAANNDKKNKFKILILGFTFKENIPDIRNTKIFSLVRNFIDQGNEVEVHDPQADLSETKYLYDLALKTNIENIENIEDKYDCIVGAVPHKQYLDFSNTNFNNLLKPNGLIADIKNMWQTKVADLEFNYWSL